MPRYRLAEPACINSELLQAGAVVEFDGMPGRGFIPLDAEAEKRKAQYEEQLAARRAAAQRLVVERAMRDMDPQILAGIRKMVREDVLNEIAQARAKAVKAKPAPSDVA